jgi:hypothetical protein
MESNLHEYQDRNKLITTFKYIWTFSFLDTQAQDSESSEVSHSLHDI